MSLFFLLESFFSASGVTSAAVKLVQKGYYMLGRNRSNTQYCCSHFGQSHSTGGHRSKKSKNMGDFFNGQVYNNQGRDNDEDKKEKERARNLENLHRHREKKKQRKEEEKARMVHLKKENQEIEERTKAREQVR